MSYTKGPWKHDDVWALIKGPKGEEIAAIHSGQNDGERVDRNIAYENASLIAAAPEMVEALDLLTEYVEAYVDLDDLGKELIEKAKQTLTNAKGGQP